MFTILQWVFRHITLFYTRVDLCCKLRRPNSSSNSSVIRSSKKPELNRQETCQYIVKRWAHQQYHSTIMMTCTCSQNCTCIQTYKSFCKYGHTNLQNVVIPMEATLIWCQGQCLLRCRYVAPVVTVSTIWLGKVGWSKHVSKGQSHSWSWIGEVGCFIHVSKGQSHSWS